MKIDRWKNPKTHDTITVNLTQLQAISLFLTMFSTQYIIYFSF